MSNPQARIVATLLACAAGIAAAEGLGTQPKYTWDELQSGRDINEGIYHSLVGSEFDEWRVYVGAAPSLDRIQVKGEINDAAYPGPVPVETDRVVSNPEIATYASLTWVLGDFDRADRGWYYGLGFEYTRRAFQILYGIGTISPTLQMSQFGTSLQIGYMWYVHPRWRLELASRFAAGATYVQFDTVELENGFADLRSKVGPYIEGGGRAAVAWHPTGTQSWNIGTALDYRSGYAQAIYKNSGPLGDNRTEMRMWWYGFSASVFYSHRF